jgi:predicted HicB family RNase H-like nuclease
MKTEYDFSKAERGRFYRSRARFNLPVYLDPAVEKRLATAARRRGEDLGTLVNRLLKHEIELAEALR